MPKIYSMQEKGCDFAGEFAYVGRTTATLEERQVGTRGTPTVVTPERFTNICEERTRKTMS